MKRIITFCCGAILFGTALSSCNFGGDANAIKNPTVDEMEAMEKKWGMEPRKVQQRSFPTQQFDTSPLAGRVPVQPAPEPAPLPQPPDSAPQQPVSAPSIPPSLR
jgi:hypothetical protein